MVSACPLLMLAHASCPCPVLARETRRNQDEGTMRQAAPLRRSRRPPAGAIAAFLLSMPRPSAGFAPDRRGGTPAGRRHGPSAGFSRRRHECHEMCFPTVPGGEGGGVGDRASTIDDRRRSARSDDDDDDEGRRGSSLLRRRTMLLSLAATAGFAPPTTLPLPARAGDDGSPGARTPEEPNECRDGRLVSGTIAVAPRVVRKCPPPALSSRSRPPSPALLASEPDGARPRRERRARRVRAVVHEPGRAELPVEDARRRHRHGLPGGEVRGRRGGTDGR